MGHATLTFCLTLVVKLTNGTSFHTFKELERGYDFTASKKELESLEQPFHTEANISIYSAINEILVVAKERKDVVNIINQSDSGNKISHRGFVHQVFFYDDLNKSYLILMLNGRKTKIFFNEVDFILRPAR
jgi:hypothetical protein